jgi:hypothetical protein
MSQVTRIPDSEAFARISARLRAVVTSDAFAWWEAGRQRVTGGDPAPLAALFPALVRKLGRDPLLEPTDAGRFLAGERFLVDLAAYRRADAAGALLALAAVAGGADPSFLRTRFNEGDLDERTTVLRTLPFLGGAPVVLDLMGEAQRSNTQDHFEAAACDSDVAMRRLPQADLNRMVLKMAFLDVPVWRMLGGLQRADGELSRKLQDFATEREAAGRPVWVGTLAFIARAPVDGTRARLVGHLEHGDDRQRLAAAQNIAVLRDRSLARYVRERLGRELSPAIRAAMHEALAKLE